MPAEMRYAHIDGADLGYVDVGRGEPVLFVHGAITDHRYWHPQIEHFSAGFRCLAFDQRHFGCSRHSDDKPLAPDVHAEDLCLFIESVIGQASHVVATSYGSGVVLSAAVARPSLFKSLFLNEPFLAALVTEPADRKIVIQALKGLAPVAAALSDRNNSKAVELFCDWTAFPGSFAALPENIRTIFLDNASTVARQLAAPPPSVELSQLRAIDVPISLSVGELTIPFFSVQVHAAHQALPRSHVVVIPGSHHGGSLENAPEFNAKLQRHLEEAAA